MTDGQLESVARLQRRIEALEASLAAAQTRSARPRSLGPAFGYVVPILALASWATAQPELTPKEELIRKSPDGTIEVTAPFRVVNAGGTVILGVAANEDPRAATSIQLLNSGGSLRIQSGEGATMAGIGVNPDGHGQLFTKDRQGQVRAFVGRSVVVRNESGKQVAALLSSEGKGVVGVWGAGGAGERVVALTEGSTGAGTVTVYDKTHNTLAVLGADDGNGNLELFGKGKSESVAFLGVNQRGAGRLGVMEAGGKSAVWLTGAHADDGLASVSVVSDGRTKAVLSTNSVGAGDLILHDAEGKLGMEAVGAPQGNPARGGAVLSFNKEGDIVASLGNDGAKGGGVAVLREGKTLAYLSSEGEAGQLGVNSAEGKFGVRATGSTGAGGGGIVAFNATEDPVASLGTSAKGDRGILTIYEKDHAVAELMADANGAGYLYLTDAQGKIALDADGFTGELAAFSKEQVVATLGSSDKGKGRIAVFGKAGAIAELGENSSSGGIVLVRNSKNAVVAGVTGGVNDTGAVVVKNASGATVSDMSATSDGRGQVAVYDAGGGPPIALLARSPESNGGILQVSNGKQSVVHLMATARGGGYLQINSASGTTVVEAGAGSDGTGVVRAGPRFKCEPTGGLAKPQLPDCIVGKP